MIAQRGGIRPPTLGGLGNDRQVALVERHHTVLGKEDIDFVRGDALVLAGQPVEDNELVSVVLVNLWPLATARHVFQGERVKVEPLADASNLFGSRIDDV